MLEDIIVTHDVMLLLTVGAILLGGLCLVGISTYNFYYIRQNKKDFYRLFKGQEWVEGTVWEYPSFHSIGHFIFIYTIWKYAFKLKRHSEMRIKFKKEILITLFVEENDILDFENSHANWLNINMLTYGVGMFCAVWMFIYAIFLFD